MSSVAPTAAISLIKEFEGCHRIDPNDQLVHAYPDPASGAEPWTIGWGTTVYPDGRPVGQNDAITKEDADKFFVTDLQENYWQPISTSIPHWNEMNDLMRSALCSFAYNLGSGFYGAEGFNTISRCLREKEWDDVPEALMLYHNPGTAVAAGLKRRRKAEGALWEQGLALLPVGDELPPSLIFEAITETFLKKERLDSTQLGPHQLVPVETGRQWKIERVLQENGHSRQVRLAYGAGDWWIYSPHWKEVATPLLVSSSDQTTELGAELSAITTENDLDVPYRSQLDNVENPHGSCNVTSVAMCLLYLGMSERDGVQLEDQLYRKMEQLGKSRHSPYDLKFLIETYPGYKDIFRENGSFKDIRTSIDAGNPVIIHGYFTRFGHIVVVRGYDANGFLVNDPYGEWFRTGYDNSRSGKRLHYSYGLIARTCSPESQANPRNIWYHTVFKV